MLSFTRTKVIGVESPKENILLAHGVLDDNIYAMELDVEVKLPDFEITGIQGRMKRTTTAECWKAVPKLGNAIGLRIGEERFISKINRGVGKQGCSHFANLLLECCDAIRQQAIYGGWQKLKEKDASLSKENFLIEQLKKIPGLKDSCLLYS